MRFLLHVLRITSCMHGRPRQGDTLPARRSALEALPHPHASSRMRPFAAVIVFLSVPTSSADSELGSAHGADITLPVGERLYARPFVYGGIDGRLTRILKLYCSREKDIYQFGVFTGNGLKKIAHSIHKYGRIWGFDSFQGIPPESQEEVENWKDEAGGPKRHFLKGGYSAANALGMTSLRTVMHTVKARIGLHRNVTLIPGFFNESLTDGLLRRHHFRPALHVDMDADIYLSAMQALDWMFAHKLIVPSTFVRYDDWPRRNATFGPAAGGNFYGQARAHYELSVKYDVRWKLVAQGTLQVVQIGADVCPPSVCDATVPWRNIFPEGPGRQTLLPMWGLPNPREGLS